MEIHFHLLRGIEQKGGSILQNMNDYWCWSSHLLFESAIDALKFEKTGRERAGSLSELGLRASQ
jgi:hypothetical protein